MTQQKSNLVSNHHFANLALDVNLHQYILADNASQMNYSPPYLASSPSCISVIMGQEEHKSTCSTFDHLILYEKNVADVVEAIMGAIYVVGGLRSCCEFIHYIHMQSDINLELIQNNGHVLDHVSMWEFHQTDEILNVDDDFCKTCLKGRYKFKNYELLKSALMPGNLIFERLEFIGDAILDFIATVLLIKSIAQDSTPGILTNLRSTATCNYTFSILCIRFQFVKYIGPHSHLDKINKFKINHSDAFDDPEWYPLGPSEEGPKILGDVFEAIAGAVFIDSGGDLNAVANAFLEWVDLIRFKLRPETFMHHPVTKLMIMCQDEKCRFNSFEYDSNEEIKSAKFIVHGRGVGFGSGHNKKNARREASVDALRVIEQDAVKFW
ncbi:hypothetical protein AKO1_001419, partial [Acrasis kona]